MTFRAASFTRTNSKASFMITNLLSWGTSRPNSTALSTDPRTHNLLVWTIHFNHTWTRALPLIKETDLLSYILANFPLDRGRLKDRCTFREFKQAGTWELHLMEEIMLHITSFRFWISLIHQLWVDMQRGTWHPNSAVTIGCKIKIALNN
jgi:hypothetical protein